MLIAALLIAMNSPGQLFTLDDDSEAPTWPSPKTVEARVILHDPGRASDAARLFQEAADKGDPVAMTYLGYLYYTGLGVAPDYAVSAKWYWEASVREPEAKLRAALMFLSG